MALSKEEVQRVLGHPSLRADDSAPRHLEVYLRSPILQPWRALLVLVGERSVLAHVTRMMETCSVSKEPVICMLVHLARLYVQMQVGVLFDQELTAEEGAVLQARFSAGGAGAVWRTQEMRDMTDAIVFAILMRTLSQPSNTIDPYASYLFVTRETNALRLAYPVKLSQPNVFCVNVSPRIQHEITERELHVKAADVAAHMHAVRKVFVEFMLLDSTWPTELIVNAFFGVVPIIVLTVKKQDQPAPASAPQAQAPASAPQAQAPQVPAPAPQVPAQAQAPAPAPAPASPQAQAKAAKAKVSQEIVIETPQKASQKRKRAASPELSAGAAAAASNDSDNLDSDAESDVESDSSDEQSTQSQLPPSLPLPGEGEAPVLESAGPSTAHQALAILAEVALSPAQSPDAEAAEAAEATQQTPAPAAAKPSVGAPMKMRVVVPYVQESQYHKVTITKSAYKVPTKVVDRIKQVVINNKELALLNGEFQRCVVATRGRIMSSMDALNVMERVANYSSHTRTPTNLFLLLVCELMCYMKARVKLDDRQAAWLNLLGGVDELLKVRREGKFTAMIADIRGGIRHHQSVEEVGHAQCASEYETFIVGTLSIASRFTTELR